jgi:hypothetical protein
MLHKCRTGIGEKCFGKCKYNYPKAPNDKAKLNQYGFPECKRIQFKL